MKTGGFLFFYLPFMNTLYSHAHGPRERRSRWDAAPFPHEIGNRTQDRIADSLVFDAMKLHNSISSSISHIERKNTLRWITDQELVAYHNFMFTMIKGIGTIQKWEQDIFLALWQIMDEKGLKYTTLESMRVEHQVGIGVYDAGKWRIEKSSWWTRITKIKL